MALVFHRRLAIPLWVIAFFTVALTAPPGGTVFLMPRTTLFAMAAVGIAALLFLMPGPIPWLRSSRARVRMLPSGHRDRASTPVRVATGPAVRMLDEPNRSVTDDARDLGRMDDDGGWQMASPGR